MGKNGSVDTKEIEQLLKDIGNMKGDVQGFVRQCTDELGQRLLRKAIKRTPVGRKPKFEGEKTVKVKGKSGKTRTFLTKEKADYDMRMAKYWSGHVGGNLRRSWRMSSTLERGSNYTLTVENPAKYASYVEHGHRQTPGRYVPALGKTLKVAWVRGRHMLSDSTNEIEDLTPRYVRVKLNKFIKEHMNV